MSDRYEIVHDARGLGLHCRQCGTTSYNANDVALRYCPQCRAWLADLPPAAPSPPPGKEGKDGSAA